MYKLAHPIWGKDYSKRDNCAISRTSVSRSSNTMWDAVVTLYSDKSAAGSWLLCAQDRSKNCVKITREMHERYTCCDYCSFMSHSFDSVLYRQGCCALSGGQHFPKVRLAQWESPNLRVPYAKHLTHLSTTMRGARGWSWKTHRTQRTHTHTHPYRNTNVYRPCMCEPYSVNGLVTQTFTGQIEAEKASHTGTEHRKSDWVSCGSAHTWSASSRAENVSLDCYSRGL